MAILLANLEEFDENIPTKTFNRHLKILNLKLTKNQNHGQDIDREIDI